MVRRSIIGILLACVVVFGAGAQEVPVLIQPRDAGYSQEQLSVLQEAITRLEVVLNSNRGSMRQLGSGGWTLGKFAAFTAGTLERLGHQVAIVSRQPGTSGTEIWVVVHVDLGGASGWIPVQPLPNIDSPQRDLGNVPLVGQLLYDPSYLSYDTVVELPPNLLPTAVIRAPMQDVVETNQSAWFGNMSRDPDGEIVLFQWTFGEVVQRPTHSISTWHTFDVGGTTYIISLTVTDSRGGQATVTTTVYVLTLEEEAAKHCGC